MSANPNVEVALDLKCQLGEGPIWDSKLQKLLWINIVAKEVHVYDPKTKKDEVLNVGQMVGTIVPRKQGGAVVALENGFHFLDLNDGKVTKIIDPENVPNNRFNDGKCDPAGRLYAGTMDMKAAKEKGALYVLDTDLSARKILDKTTISNGIIWSPDHTKMYYTDSPKRTIDVFDYDIKTGNISNRQVLIALEPGDDVPDGNTIDADGNLWVAHWGGSKVTQWNPHTKELMRTVHVPASQITAVAFGGPTLEDLYITSARIDLDDEKLSKEPLAGALFVTRIPGVKGVPASEFAG